MSDTKPLGFLQEDFHSEVLSFLFELVSTKFPNRKMILYNIQDRYDNKSIYKQMYKNLEIRDLQSFFPDLNNNVCEKTFVISYDNIVHFSLFLQYKNDLIFITHSPKHVEIFKKHDVKYFALTGLLSTDFMLPITNKTLSKEFFSDHKLNADVANMDIMQTIRNRNLTVLLIVGSFFENNKDIGLLKNIIDTKDYIIVVCTTELTKELTDFVKDNQDYVYVSLNLTTRDLRFTIAYFDIKYLLFTPPKESKFYTSSWSGSIQFAFDHDLHIIIPNIIAKIYDIDNPDVISYKCLDDIINGIKSSNKNITYYQKIRDDIFLRNKIVFDSLFNNIKTSNVGHFKINYHEHQSDVDNKVISYQKIIDTILTTGQLKEQLQNKLIISVDPDDTIFMLTSILLEHSCNVEAFISDYETAKYYKDIFTYNNKHNHIKFYHGLLGSTHQTSHNKNIPETYTLDHLKYTKPVFIIYTNSDLVNDVILGALGTINTCNPFIFVKNKSIQKYNDTITLLKNYSSITIDNFTIYTPSSFKRNH